MLYLEIYVSKCRICGKKYPCINGTRPYKGGTAGLLKSEKFSTVNPLPSVGHEKKS